MADKPSYTSLSGGPGVASQTSAAWSRFDQSVESASAWINFSKRTRMIIMTSTTAFTIISACCALGAPWTMQYSRTPTGGSSYQYTTSSWSLTRYATTTCTNAGSGASDQCTNNGSVWAGGVQKAVGDATAAAFTLVLLESLYLTFKLLRLLCGRVNHGLPLGPKVAADLQWHVGLHGLAALIGTFTFAWWFTPSTMSGTPSTASNPAQVVVWYGGGFALAVITVLIAAWNWSNTSIMIELEQGEVTGAAPGASVVLPPAGAPAAGFYAQPTLVVATATPVVTAGDVTVVASGAYHGGDTSGVDASTSSYQGYNSYQAHQ